MSPPGKKQSAADTEVELIKDQGLSAPSPLNVSLHRLPRLPVQLWETLPTSRSPARPLRSASPLAPCAVTQGLAGKGWDCSPRHCREEGLTTHGGGAGGRTKRGALAPQKLYWGAGKPGLTFPLGPLWGLAEPGLWHQDPMRGAGWRGRHEGSGLHHVLRVPHARSVAPAPHVRPTTLTTTFASRPCRSAFPRPEAWCLRPRRPRDVGGHGSPPTRSGAAGPCASSGACSLCSRPPA